MIIRLLHSLPLLYLLLLWPGRYVIWGLFDSSWYYGQMMYDSGVWSVRMLLLTLAVTPMLLVINWSGRARAVGRWLLPRRRHFGLISFIYASLHLAHYIKETASLSDILLESIALEFALGWLAFVIFAALALTSTNAAMRRLGGNWKRLHLWIYPAIALSLMHWFLFDQFTARVLFWVTLFVALKLGHGCVRSLRKV